jgi:hypothetical protein
MGSKCDFLASHAVHVLVLASCHAGEVHARGASTDRSSFQKAGSLGVRIAAPADVVGVG